MDISNLENFGEILRNTRKSKGLTQQELADLSGISRRAIVHYENHVKQPVIEKVEKLAKVLGVSMDFLFGVEKPSVDSMREDGATYKIMKRVKIIEKLPVNDQNRVFKLINELAEKNNLK